MQKEYFDSTLNTKIYWNQIYAHKNECSLATISIWRGPQRHLQTRAKIPLPHLLPHPSYYIYNIYVYVVYMVYLSIDIDTPIYIRTCLYNISSENESNDQESKE